MSSRRSEAQRRLVHEQQGRSTRAVPVIAYHAVDEGPPPLCLHPDEFARHVEILVELGCVTLTVQDLAQHGRSGTPLPDRSVVLTFDDGYASVHSTVLPLLDANGFVATVFPVTGHLGARSLWNEGRSRDLELLTRSQLEELHGAGWEIGGHTHQHLPLPALDEATLRDEIQRSNTVLADITGTPPLSFAYPYGWHDRRSRAIVGETYQTCMTIGANRGRWSEPADQVARIDAAYLRRGWHVRHLHRVAGTAYLLARRLARDTGCLVRGIPVPGLPPAFEPARSTGGSR